MARFHEYNVVGRRLPSEKDATPKLYRMRIFAPNPQRAKSRFWYYMKRLRNLKRANGELVSCSEIYEKKPQTVKNFGVWIRYDSRSGTHNMYKEYRELTRCDAVSTCYLEMAGRHRARQSSVQILRVGAVKTSELRRPHMTQMIKKNLSFPLPNRLPRSANKSTRSTFVARRPNTTF
eukprot:NODE_1774_length_743_cov_20.897727_g1724_i0.p1 GENE.NODE_1774_length_743_cov_20.897727_g1724_i0~~NODE_1774_length_743_cov_20.897727_g1724_i0.p1  ORF type:complete len:177 (-),score=37.76 NODE_1774_length_743_cov_20.897727_g1724_i0:26-556(-)